MLIDDFTLEDHVCAIGTCWRPVSDRVMGGISSPALTVDEYAGRRCLRLSGDVRLDNNGGFIQMGLDLATGGGVLDARAFTGLRLVVAGNGERYSVHLRTVDIARPWQSYRAHFETSTRWQTVCIDFDRFVPHRIDVDLNLARLRRIGLVAIGRAFFADLRVAELALYH